MPAMQAYIGVNICSVHLQTAVKQHLRSFTLW